MRLLLGGEYNARVGSGYTTIVDGLVQQLTGRGHQVVVLAFDYDGSEHQLDAAVVSSDPRMFLQQAVVIRAGFKPDAMIMAGDLSQHHGVRSLQASFETPYIGIFPVEADPLIYPTDWTNTIDTMDAALCESKFGTKLLEDVGLRVRYLPIGIDEFWRPPNAGERARARRSRNIDDRFVILTVCDNHIRKNLPAHFAAIALLAGEKIEWPVESGKTRRERGRSVVPETYYIVNTKRRSGKGGFQNYHLTERFGISERCMVLEHQPNEGLNREELRELYWCADAYLQLSQAEGLGLPVMEAQRCGVPVVGTDCTGIAENLADGRGLAVSPEWTTIDPFQNQYRRWADPSLAAQSLASIHKDPRWMHTMVDESRRYAEGFTWPKTADIVEEVLNDVKRRAEEIRARAEESVSNSPG